MIANNTIHSDIKNEDNTGTNCLSPSNKLVNVISHPKNFEWYTGQW